MEKKMTGETLLKEKSSDITQQYLCRYKNSNNIFYIIVQVQDFIYLYMFLFN